MFLLKEDKNRYGKKFLILCFKARDVLSWDTSKYLQFCEHICTDIVSSLLQQFNNWPRISKTLRSKKKALKCFEVTFVWMVFNDEQFSSIKMANNLAFTGKTLECFAFTNSYKDRSVKALLPNKFRLGQVCHQMSCEKLAFQTFRDCKIVVRVMNVHYFPVKSAPAAPAHGVALLWTPLLPTCGTYSVLLGIMRCLSSWSK